MLGRDCQGVQLYYHNIRQTCGTRLCLSSSSSIPGFLQALGDQAAVLATLAVAPVEVSLKFILDDFDERPGTHIYRLNRDEMESNLSAPGIQGNQENALIKSIKMSPHLICL